MTKPAGALCNLECRYCYYLEKEKLYAPDTSFRMPRQILETYIRDYIASQPTPEVRFTWQGGEPTLLGLGFFEEAVLIQQKHAGGKRISNSIQTNGTLLDDDWCSFFSGHGFLVGLSIDGPEELHDAYRVDRGGHPSFNQVMRGLELLRKHGTEFNTLTVVNRLNSRAPQEVYAFLKEIGSRFLQFIPLVEREPDPGARALELDLAFPPGREEGEVVPVTPWSVGAEQYGTFLLAIFNEWVRHDVGSVFVQLFDTTLAGWTGAESPLCVFARTCGNAMVLEHNGDVFSCDHYVYPDYRLGNIADTPIDELAALPEQIAFGQAKRDTLPGYCRGCEVRFLCKGECPKHRFVHTPDGEPGLNYLCPSYKKFFTETAFQFQSMADLLKRQRAPAEIMSVLKAMDLKAALGEAGRNDPCPCGSGQKVKKCCGRHNSGS